MDSYRHTVSWWGLVRAELQRPCALQGAGEAIAAAELSTAGLREPFLCSSVIHILVYMQEANPWEKIISSILSCHNQKGWVTAPITSPHNYGGMAELCRSHRKERGIKGHENSRASSLRLLDADNPC